MTEYSGGGCGCPCTADEYRRLRDLLRQGLEFAKMWVSDFSDCITDDQACDAECVYYMGPDKRTCQRARAWLAEADAALKEVG